MKFNVSVKNRNEFNDYDYLHILSAVDYDWLRRFHRESLNPNSLVNISAIVVENS